MEELYRENVKIVYGYMYSLCKNRDEAENLTQEVFLKAMESLGRFNGQCKFSVWLCQIGRHLWYQKLRKAGREIPSGDDIYELMDHGKTETSAENMALINLELKRLLKAIAELKDNSRETVVLRLFYDLSFREIGHILSKSENWARVTYYRSKEKLLRELED